MKLNFRKISALASSALMLGMTAGIAAAANYPAPFVVGGSPNVAIVYGKGAAFSDQTAGSSIAESLSGFASGISVEGGESFMLDKASNHFNFADELDDVFTSLDGDEMTFLADGSYDDEDVDVDYEQSITPSNKALTLFADTDYANDAPTIGFHWTNGQTILSYTIDFDDDVNYTEMVDTSMPLMGKEYYVLAASATQIDVLDTAETNTLGVGESATIGGRSVTLAYVDATHAKFTVDGQNTGNLVENDEFKLRDDSYIVVTDISYQDYAGGIQSAEFAIGSGKIELISGEEAELNNEDIDGLEVTITDGSTGMDSLTLTWKSDRDTFLTEANSISMPTLGTISLAFGGMNFPSSPETISVENGDTLTLNMGNYDLPVMWFQDGVDVADQLLGEEDNLLKLEADDYTYTELGYSDLDTPWWTGVLLNDSTTTNVSNSVTTEGLNVSEDERFLVTRIDDDLTDVETLYYEVATIDIDDADTWTVELDDLIGSNDLTFTDSVGDTDDSGDVTVTIVGFSADNSSAVLEFSASGTITYNKVVSEKGLVVTIPTNLPTASTNGTGGTLTFREPDKDGEGGVNLGREFTATITNTSNDKFHVSNHNLTAYDEEESDDHFIGYVPSDLASKFTFDTSADENDFSIEFYGTEVTADVRVVAGGTISATGGVLGDVLVTDAEVSSVSSKNLVVVGGSCINSAAAALVGGKYCGSAWTTATEVGAGKFLIKGYSSSSITSRMALLVAGYEAGDTTNAATWLRTNGAVDTSKTYIGTSGTSATLQVS